MKSAVLVFLLILVKIGAAQPTIQWSRVDSMPIDPPRVEYGFFVIDSSFYLVGGADSNYVYHHDAWKYNFHTNIWQRMQDMPIQPNSNDGGATSTNFILGGHGYFCLGGGNFCTQQVWEYYPPADTWSHKRDFPGIYREGASGFIYGNKAYVGLGFSCSQPLRDLWEYDPIGDIWTGVDSIPAQGRFGANVAVIDSYAYFFGGLINNFNYTNEVWRYNIPANIWQHLSNIPGVARAVSICYPLRTTILYGYGATDWPNTAGDMYLYDTQTDQWQPVICNGFLDSIGDGASFIYDHYGYFLGGSTGKWNFKKDLWKFDTADIYRHTDIEQIAVTKGAFQIYPAVLVPGQALRIRSDYSGSIIFYNSLGQEVYKHFFNEELTVIQATDIPHKDGLLFYQAMLKNGPVATGKIILIR